MTSLTSSFQSLLSDTFEGDASSAHNPRYAQAGVSLDTAAKVVHLAKEAAQKTPQTVTPLSGLGGFSAAFELPAGYQQPVILTGCDGVGTKLKLAAQLNNHRTIGIDLVAMNANDILASGGQPIAFLDYIASADMKPEWLAQVFEGLSTGCQQADCTLVGGETAEMPGVYARGDYDLAGFCLGVAEKANLLPQKERLAPGDAVIGLASSGFHSNGYSLVRHILAEHEVNLTDPAPWDSSVTLGDALLEPTRIYVKPVQSLLRSEYGIFVKAMAHITGGGFYENLPRMLPEALAIALDTAAWQLPPLFAWLAHLGAIDTNTLYQTFNCGIGFALVVPAQQAEAVVSMLNQCDGSLSACVMGLVVPRRNENEPLVLANEPHKLPVTQPANQPEA